MNFRSLSALVLIASATISFAHAGDKAGNHENPLWIIEMSDRGQLKDCFVLQYDYKLCQRVLLKVEEQGSSLTEKEIIVATHCCGF